MPVIATAAHLAKDPAAWVGSVMSTIAAVVSRDGFLPNTLEGCAALTLTLCTIVYIVSKTIILWRNQKRKKVAELDGEVL